MIGGIGIRDKASSVGTALRETVSWVGRWSVQQVQSVVDLPRWRAAPSLKERVAAVSWLRIAGFAGCIAAIALGVLAACGVFRHKPGPGPLPTERELSIRAKALTKFNPTPPRGLAEANKSVPQSRSEGGSR